MIGEEGSTADVKFCQVNLSSQHKAVCVKTYMHLSVCSSTKVKQVTQGANVLISCLKHINLVDSNGADDVDKCSSLAANWQVPSRQKL